MRNLEYRNTLKNAVVPKFQGERYLVSKYRPLYPYGVEREYVKLVDDYMSLLKKILFRYLPEMQKAMRGESFHTDADAPVMTSAALRQIFAAMQRELDKRSFDFDLYDRLNRIANKTRKLSIQEWERVVQRTLGINLYEDYYYQNTYEDLIPKWVEENVNRIVRIPKENLNEMQTITLRDVNEGKSIRGIMRDIQDSYGTSKQHARLVARDQTGKLYGNLAKYNQTEAGCTHYIWSGVMDNRERLDHVDREGEKYSWDNPPDDGHPGEPICCRCVALAIFDWEELDLVGE